MANRITFIPLLVAAVVLLPTLDATACPDDQIVAATAEAFRTKTPGPGFPDGTSLEDGYCAQDKYLASLAEELGERTGYKAGLTNQALQERFGAIEPVGGVLFKSMLLPSGSEIEADFGVRSVYEADLILTAADERINEARTLEEAVRYLGEVTPFVELLDLVIAEGEPQNLATIVGYNVVSRYGVVGEGVPVEPTPAFIEALRKMESVTLDDTGREIQRAKGAAIMGHPLNVLLWLVEHVGAQGQRLQAGDVLSLGAMGTFHLTEAGRTITVRYTGLPGGDSGAVVTFR